MDDSELAFWSTAAQLTVVLTLALVVEFRSAFRPRTSPRMTRFDRAIATVQIVSAALAIAAAFVQCLVTLSSGTSSSSAINAVSWTLVISFALLIVGPVADVVRRIWYRPKPKKRRRTGEAVSTTNA
jgi:choline-glycine betaine transporter